jgi:hypothetical protein
MDLMNFDGTNLTLNLPDVTAWGQAEWIKFAITFNVIYGLITHLVSIPAVRRYNKLVDESGASLNSRRRWKISDGEMIGLLRGRVRGVWGKFRQSPTVYLLGFATGCYIGVRIIWPWLIEFVG